MPAADATKGPEAGIASQPLLAWNIFIDIFLTISVRHSIVRLMAEQTKIEASKQDYEQRIQHVCKVYPWTAVVALI